MKDWQRQEKNLARIHKGSRTPGSGAHAIKGDVIGDIFLIEAKHSNQFNSKGHYIDLKKSWFTKLLKEAKTDKKHRIPMLNINIGNYANYSILEFDSWNKLWFDLDKDGTVCVGPYLSLIDKEQIRIYISDLTEDPIYDSVFIEPTEYWIIVSEPNINLLLKLIRDSNSNKEEYNRKVVSPIWKKKQESPEKRQLRLEKERLKRKEIYRKKKETIKKQINSQSS